MILISHRGNIFGKDPARENSLDYINKALLLGYEVEIDVWHQNGEWYLGHDEPQYLVEEEFLKNNKVWCHAKNILALKKLLKLNAHCFWHQEDDFTITSKGYIWAYPSNEEVENTICVLPEINDCVPKNCLGICSDYIGKYKIENEV
jgi:hypothetical protein